MKYTNKLVGASLLLTGILLIFLGSDAAGAIKLLGTLMGMAGMFILAHPHRKEERLAIETEIQIWAEEHGFRHMECDYMGVINFENDGGIHIHYNIETDRLKISRKDGLKPIFNGRIHNIAQLESLMEIIH